MKKERHSEVKVGDQFITTEEGLEVKVKKVTITKIDLPKFRPTSESGVVEADGVNTNLLHLIPYTDEDFERLTVIAKRINKQQKHSSQIKTQFRNLIRDMRLLS